MNKPTTRSHYLPRTYLKHFLFEDALFMYMKGEKFFKNDCASEQRIFKIKGESELVNIGLQNNLYQLDVQGFTANDIEEIFQEYGENFLDEVIAKIAKKRAGEKIDQELKDKLCIFLGAMRVRTPLLKWETEEASSVFLKYSMGSRMQNISVAELKKEMETTGKDYTEEQIEIAQRAFVDKKYELKWPNALFLKSALLGLEMHANIFHKMRMIILRSNNNRHFVTSDNPVVYFVPQEKINFYNPPRSLMSPHTEVFFVLTRNIAVHLSRAEKLKEIIMDTKRDTVDMFNYNISHNSFNFIFSPIQMNSLEQFIKEYTPYPFRITMR